VHTPVMVDEMDAHLEPSRGGVFVDGTVGMAGHTRRLLDAGATRVIGIDRDPDALAYASDALREYGDRVSLVHGDYRNLVEVLDARGIEQVDGVLADLGVSSMQLDAPDRGFSFRRDEPLDMRMDRSSGDGSRHARSRR
jgi:16S rRNA (cytosine1402-N4)-methyltransferase